MIYFLPTVCIGNISCIQFTVYHLTTQIVTSFISPPVRDSIWLWYLDLQQFSKWMMNLPYRNSFQRILCSLSHAMNIRCKDVLFQSSLTQRIWRFGNNLHFRWFPCSVLGFHWYHSYSVDAFRSCYYVCARRVQRRYVCLYLLDRWSCNVTIFCDLLCVCHNGNTQMKFVVKICLLRNYSGNLEDYFVMEWNIEWKLFIERDSKSPKY